MSLFESASLVVTPNGTKASKLYSVKPADGSGDMTVTRATTATRVNASGIIESVATNVPRLDYTGSTCPGILLEPQRTNLVTYSEDFSNASWSKSNAAITPNAITSPDGTVDADTLIGDGTNTPHSISKLISFVSGSIYTYSAYIKKNTNNFVQFLFPSSCFSSTSWANFDLNNGVVGSAGAGSTSSITNVGNGWYRCTITSTSTTSALSNLLIYLTTSATSPRVESNTLTTSVFIWGAQLEVGAYPTSYIPTVASTVTRNRDVITRNNIYTNGLITSDGGTWFVELNNNVPYIRDSTSRLGISDTSTFTNNFLTFYLTGASSRLRIAKSISNIFTDLYTTTTNTVKIAIKWNGTTADIFENGVKVVSATSFIPTNMEFLNSTTNDVPKYIKSTMLFPTPLTDTECINLTTL